MSFLFLLAARTLPFISRAQGYGFKLFIQTVHEAKLNLIRLFLKLWKIIHFFCYLFPQLIPNLPSLFESHPNFINTTIYFHFFKGTAWSNFSSWFRKAYSVVLMNFTSPKEGDGVEFFRGIFKLSIDLILFDGALSPFTDVLMNIIQYCFIGNFVEILEK